MRISDLFCFVLFFVNLLILWIIKPFGCNINLNFVIVKTKKNRTKNRREKSEGKEKANILIHYIVSVNCTETVKKN